eukprot:CAMPEP_0168322726 /NCGR_PEP_ID=MMETSP0213-20121227/3064_1 /TAXON_ID=151035 /ORGANISM="Euplotes harpa, Strain FSP1.4" /LENGTH=108 /DNA_ID=CAMNT_0008324675 /DNA_START=11 /DNA_END=337 /DNA_ORIENTATION=+
MALPEIKAAACKRLSEDSADSKKLTGYISEEDLSEEIVAEGHTGPRKVSGSDFVVKNMGNSPLQNKGSMKVEERERFFKSLEQEREQSAAFKSFILKSFEQEDMKNIS